MIRSRPPQSTPQKMRDGVNRWWTTIDDHRDSDQCLLWFVDCPRRPWTPVRKTLSPPSLFFGFPEIFSRSRERRFLSASSYLSSIFLGVFCNSESSVPRCATFPRDILPG